MKSIAKSKVGYDTDSHYMIPLKVNSIEIE